MNMKYIVLRLVIIFVLFTLGVETVTAIPAFPKTREQVIKKLVKLYGHKQRFRIQRGVEQVAAAWYLSDGNAKDFSDFCLKYYIHDPVKLEKTLRRIETNTEVFLGNYQRVSRRLFEPLDLARIEQLPIDQLYTQYSPYAHLQEELFKSKVAFVVLLNFPHYTLLEKKTIGPSWNRKQWAMALAGDLFTGNMKIGNTYAGRIPSEINRKCDEAMNRVTQYQDNYNICLGGLLDRNNRPAFRSGSMALVHWGLRDQVRAEYRQPRGIERQDILYRVMLRIVDQSIPALVIGNQELYWNPYTNEVFQGSPGKKIKIKTRGEGGRRYRFWWSIFQAETAIDPYYPSAPTLIERSFYFNRKISGKKVEKLLISILESPLARRLGKYIEKKLGRRLHPFDVFYNDFAAHQLPNLDELNFKVKERYPDTAAFEADIPVFLQAMGFPRKTADFISSRIEVDHAKGIGHALAAQMRDDNARLRLRIPAGGMDYVTYTNALHELGHNVEQVISLHMIDNYLLRGVPNGAITESFAYMFAKRSLPLLGWNEIEDGTLKEQEILGAFWFTYCTSGTALIDMKVWEWMYQHPEATLPHFQDAVLRISRDVWNRYYASVFHEENVPVLAIYNHLIGSKLYFPDYPLGQIIGYQLETFMEGKSLGNEMVRMCKIGNLPPDTWMEKAVGAPISSTPLLSATEKILKRIGF